MGFQLLSKDLEPMERGRKPTSFKLRGGRGPSSTQPNPAQPRECPMAETVCNIFMA